MTTDYASLEGLLSAARAQGAAYADIRMTTQIAQGLSLRNGEVEAVSESREQGLGVRAQCDGAWGFAGVASPDPGDWLRAVGQAVAVARASARRPKRGGARLAPEPVHRSSWRSPVRVDPFEVPVEDRLELLRSACARMREVEAVHVSQASINLWRETKLFLSTEGSRIEQDITHSGASLSALARGPHDTQRRSFGDYSSAGWEFIEEMDLPGHAATLAREANELLEAKPCPPGRTDLVLGAEMVALQIHESCGHPIELDRVLGSEATFAGTSFLEPSGLGRFGYGSPQVNMTADATLPGGLGSFGYDDEGVAAQRTVIVDRGIHVNYLTSRETAAEVGARSGGTMRAQGGFNLPLIRMTNVNLEPGDWSLSRIIRDTKRGVLLNTPKSWSLDDKRLNFHFGCEIGYEIIDGALGPMLKNGAYTALTPEFWGGCDAVAGPREWRVWGTPGCAKGEPVQIAHVGHGAAPARFCGIRVGVGS